MRLALHNIGPIRDADIRLARLTVLVGPNGSGKTLLSSVAYAVTKALHAGIEETRFAMFERIRRGDIDQEQVERIIDRWEEAFRERLEAELERSCARDLKMLGREGRSGKGAAPRILVEDGPADDPSWRLIFKLRGTSLVVERSHPKYIRPRLTAADLFKDGEPLLPRKIAEQLRRSIPRQAFYFPASRSGFMQTYSAMASLVWGALGAGYFQDATVGPIPGTAADFLQFIAQIKPTEKWERGAETAELIERSVLQGSISVQSGEGSPQVFFHPFGSEQSWPIEETATSIAELAPLVLYLRHRAAPRHAIFIDEPEAHLHPENQTALARGLSSAAGVLGHLVIATHSEFLVSELSNLTMESQLSLLSDEGSRVPSTRIYEFQGEAFDGGVSAGVLEANPREGFQIDQFAAVSDSTYSRAVDLFNALQELNGEKAKR